MPCLQTAPAPGHEAIAAVQRIDPSVASVRVHAPEGITGPDQTRAGRVLIHVRQMHDASALRDGTTVPPEVMADLERYLPKAKEQLASVLSTLAQRKLGDGLYLEGMTPDVARQYTENLSALTQGQKTAETLEQAFGTTRSEDTAKLLAAQQSRFRGRLDDPNVKQLLGALTYLRDYQSLREHVRSDPVLSLAARGQISLRGAERADLERENIDYVNRNPAASVDDPKLMAIMDRRDTHLVDTIGASGAPISVAVLGAGHDLRREVDAWNKAHPNDRITLVEVEPAAVTAYLNQGDPKAAKAIGAR